MEIEFSRLRVRDARVEDAPAIAALANNLRVVEFMPPMPHPYSLSDAEAYIQYSLCKAKEDPRTFYLYAVEQKQDNCLVGLFAFENIDKFSGTTSTGLWLGEPYWKRGYASEILTGMISFAFTDLLLQRINASICVGNQPSNALVQKLGFTYEGTRRNSVRSHSTGITHSENQYGLLRDEWFERHSKQ